MGFSIQPATRSGIKPLVGFYGKSGSGKTYSALLLARGIVGPQGRIVLIDSESGRGSIFSDLVPGGYGVINLEPPFSPGRYEEAIETAEANADCVVVDSMSHEWSGEGGVLDWADAELEKMGGGDNNKMRSWIKPKMAHKMMVMRLLRTKCALICCLRGEEKTHIVKDGGKNKVITDEFSSPLFDPRFIFELLVNFETVARNGEGGYVIPRKITHPSIKSLLPSENQQITVAHGAALAQWCAAPCKPVAPKPTTAPTGILTAKDLKIKLWTITRSVHRCPEGEKDKAIQLAAAQTLTQWMIDEAVISDTESWATLTAERLPDVIAKAEQTLKQLQLVS